MPVNPNEVPDCVYSGDSATNTWSELATDDSGEATDITADTTWAYESSSARSNLVTTKTVDVRVEHNNSTGNGTLWAWDKSGGTDYLNLNNTFFTLVIDGSTIGTLTIANITGSDEEFILTWSMEPNPDTTGASDAMRSELQCYNIDQSTYEQEVFTHAAPSADATGDLVWGARDTSGSFSYPGTITEVRMSSGFHSSTEQHETFVSQSSAPTLVGDELKPIAMPDRGDVTSGDDGEFSGPILILGAKAAQQHRATLWGPLVNDVNNEGDFLGTANSGHGQFSGYSFDSNLIRLEHAYYRPIPIGANFVVPYVYIQSNEVTTTTDLSISVYSMSQPGPLVRPASSPSEFEYYSVSTTVDDHGTGDTAGEWVQFSKLKIARDKVGFSYFVIGSTIGSGNTYRIKSVCLDPIFVAAGDGLGVGSFG